MSISKYELIQKLDEETSRRMTTMGGIHMYFDSIIDPLQKRLGFCYVWAEPAEINLAVSGDARDFAHIFKVMRANGFEPDKRPEAGQHEFTMRFLHANGVVFYLSFTSTVCKRVQIGTRMVEQPIWEAVCDGDAPTDEVQIVQPAPTDPVVDAVAVEAMPL
jgi:hypothetical protein